MSIKWDQAQNEFRVTMADEEVLTFECIDGGLCICENTNNRATIVTTVRGNMMNDTKREVQAAEEAKKLSKTWICFT